MATTAILPDPSRRATPHVLDRVERRPDGLVPIYRSTETGAERPWGLLQGAARPADLEAIFGPLRFDGARSAWVPA